MNILHINAVDNVGGAARAMYRLHVGLNRAGHTSQIMAGFQTTNEVEIHSISETAERLCRFHDKVIEYIGKRLDYRIGPFYWLYRSSFYIPKTEIFQQADVINLHNLHGGYFDYRALSLLTLSKPTVWTLHDMWPLTAHCAYSYECNRFETGCYDCPLLKGHNRQLVEPSPTRFNLTHMIWRLKRNTYKRTRLCIVTPSQWLRCQVKKSILAQCGPVEHIPHGVDLKTFYPLNQAFARSALDVPPKAKVLMFSAQGVMHPRKGFQYILKALETLNEGNLWLLTVGKRGGLQRYVKGFQVRELGYIESEELLRLAYSAADIFVFPTLADNQPLVVLEAIACGTPVVSFDVAGVPEMVRHMKTGYLAAYKDPNDLAKGIKLLLDNPILRGKLSQRCREMAEKEYPLDLQVRRYMKIYEEVIRNHLGRSNKQANSSRKVRIKRITTVKVR